MWISRDAKSDIYIVWDEEPKMKLCASDNLPVYNIRPNRMSHIITIIYASTILNLFPSLVIPSNGFGCFEIEVIDKDNGHFVKRKL